MQNFIQFQMHNYKYDFIFRCGMVPEHGEVLTKKSFIILNISFIFCKILRILLMLWSFLCDVDKRPTKLERLMYSFEMTEKSKLESIKTGS
jgi:hypothetical protein